MRRRHLVCAVWSASLVAACIDGADMPLDDNIAHDEDDEISTGIDPGTSPTPLAVGTACLNADGPGGQDTYRLIESVLGRGAVENPDGDHQPPQRHIREEPDPTVGNAFVFSAHRDIDRDNDNTDRSRIEIKVSPRSGPHAALKARLGQTFTYSWRFQLGGDMQFSSRFTHVFQLKSSGGDDGSPLVTITARRRGSRELLEVIHTGPPSRGVLASANLAGLKGQWLDVAVRATFDDRGALSMTIRRPGGAALVSIDVADLDLWRGGDHVRPKWGIYRGLSDQLRAAEDTVRFASFAITPSATPTATCR